MQRPRALVLGGGMAGMAAAYALAREGHHEVTLVEAGARLGGLAGSFERDGRSFPLGYHHILHRDRTLLYFLRILGLLGRVRWRQIRMLFRIGARNFALASPADFARFPLGAADKARFVKLMLRAFRQKDWSGWVDRSARDLIDAWASPGVREALFEPLTRIKFGLPCSEVSGAWLGARLYHREGSAALGYIPDGNWTEVLCSGLERALAESGVRVLTGTPIAAILDQGGRLAGARTAAGDTLPADIVVSTLPTELLCGLLPGESSPGLRDIQYTALTSVICATRQPIAPAFYWMNLLSREYAASGIFRLESLNPSIGRPGEHYVNFVTHYHDRTVPAFAEAGDEDLVRRYRADFRGVFGFDLDARWTVVNRIARYSPILHRGYRNPPVRSASHANLYFAGNFRTFPSVVTTGTALGSGLDAADAVLAAEGRACSVRVAAAHRRDASAWRRWRHRA